MRFVPNEEESNKEQILREERERNQRIAEEEAAKVDSQRKWRDKHKDR